MRKLLFWGIIMHIGLYSYSQVKGKWQIGNKLDISTYYVGGSSSDNSFIRQRMNDDNDIIQNAVQWNIGISAERSITSKVFLGTGISYGMLNTVMKKYAAFFNRDHFYFLESENDTELRFISTNKIRTSRDYISIPIEIRYEFLQFKKAAFYCKGGVNTGFGVGKTRTYVRTLIEDSIYSFHRISSKNFAKNNDLFVSAYATLGVRIGMLDKAVNGRVEIGLPVPVTNQINHFSLRPGVMIMGTIYLPLTTKK